LYLGLSIKEISWEQSAIESSTSSDANKTNSGPDKHEHGPMIKTIICLKYICLKKFKIKLD